MHVDERHTGLFEGMVTSLFPTVNIFGYIVLGNSGVKMSHIFRGRKHILEWRRHLACAAKQVIRAGSGEDYEVHVYSSDPCHL